MALTTQELQRRLWQAADILRGQIDSADYKNYIFSMLFPETALGRRDGSTRRSRRRWRLGVPREGRLGGHGRAPVCRAPRKPTGTRSAVHR